MLIIIQFYVPVKNCQLKIIILIILLGDNNIVPKEINNNIKKYMEHKTELIIIKFSGFLFQSYNSGLRLHKGSFT